MQIVSVLALLVPRIVDCGMEVRRILMESGLRIECCIVAMEKNVENVVWPECGIMFLTVNYFFSDWRKFLSRTF